MKFFLMLVFVVVFFSAFTRADDDVEEDDDDEPQAFSSALQLNGNNVGDINNIKGKIKISFANKQLLKSVYILQWFGMVNYIMKCRWT